MTGDEPLALEVRDLVVRFGSRAALVGVSFRVRAGEFVALVGPNGSGKTTLLRTALGFLQPSEGHARIFGDRVEELTPLERARRVAWVPQDEPMRDNVPLLDYVAYGRYAHRGMLEGESVGDRRLALRLLDEVGLGARAADGVLSVSGGERQRAILARALAQEPRLLLLDEPTTHLDIGHQLDLLGRVRALSRSRGVTVVAALHDLNLAARFAGRLVVLSHGRRVADGPPTEVLSEDLLARVWGVSADLERDRRTGLPYLVPHQITVTAPRTFPSPFVGPVHVVGGGGAAAPILRGLSEQGYRVTAGALHLLDSDAEVAEALGIPSAIESPFAPLGPEVRVQHRTLLAAARAIVIAPFAVGPSNLANLEDLLPYVSQVPTLLVRLPPIAERDFTGGRAEAIVAELRAAGARNVDDLTGVLAALRAELAVSPSAAGVPPPAPA